GLAVVGPRIENLDGTWYPSARTFPSLADAAGHAFLHFVAPRNRFSRRYRLLDWDHTAARDVDWVSGTFLMARRSDFEGAGGFDERYFMYVEDVDLCWRLWQAGHRVRYEPGGRVMHLIGVVLIAFSRSERVGAGKGPHPRLNEHVHDAYGIYDCGQFLPNLQDAKADTLGIHTHGDGLIHIHPFSSSVAGHNATLQAFGNQVNMKFSGSQLKLPTGVTLKTGGKCG